MDPLKGNAILEIDPAITFSVIDRLFGGSGEGNKSQHELTDIEQSVMEGIIVRILGNMREAWTQVIDLRPRLGQIDTNPQFAQIVPPTDMVVLVTLETKVGEVEGMINFCIPYITIEPIIGKLSTQFWFSTAHRAGTSENLTVLKDKLESVDIDVIAEVGRINLSVREVLSLRIGDVVQLYHTRIGDPYSLNIGNRPKFLCRPGVMGKKLAVQIIRKIAEVKQEEIDELGADVAEM
jgi:flagellar motor switch protein FliM